MRILIANDRVGDPGGVRSYLRTIVPELTRRGHRLALASCDGAPLLDREPPSCDLFTVNRDGVGLDACQRWAPDVCFSHNMRDLAVDERLATIAPVIKFMHGHYGTCLSGSKAHNLPSPAPCHRPFGAGCLALYYPRRCGSLRPQVLAASWQWTRRQRALFARYAAVMVASEHMRREYLSAGMAPSNVIVNPLFATVSAAEAPTPPPDAPHIVFMARMNRGKGGGLLIEGVAHASAALGRSIRLTMMGDGPQRGEWESAARARGIEATFTGWLDGDARWTVLATASAIVIPGEWLETFGLVGLEAGALGVPAIATAAGGITEWLRDGVNGVAVAPPSSAHRFGETIAAFLKDRERQTRLRWGAHAVAREMSMSAHVDRLEAALHTIAGSPADRQPIAVAR